MPQIKLSGVGMHSGLVSNIVVKPTKSGGILFVKNGVEIPAKYDNVSATFLRNTTIGRKPNQVQTIEHLMAALFVCRIKNAEIRIDNDETPILDGSAREFIKALKIVKPTGKMAYLRLKKEIIVRQSEIALPLWLRFFNFIKGKKPDGFVKLSPVKGNRLEITAELNYKMPVIGRQKYGFVFDYDNFPKSVSEFVKNVAMTRTFGTEAEWEFLKKRGMGKGANGENVLAINREGTDTLNDMFHADPAAKKRILEEYGYLLPNGKKIVKKYFKDEFVRHKIIDSVGDLYTSGFFIVGKMEIYKGGHALNNLVLKKLFADSSNYDIMES